MYLLCVYICMQKIKYKTFNFNDKLIYKRSILNKKDIYTLSKKVYKQLYEY